MAYPSFAATATAKLPPLATTLVPAGEAVPFADGAVRFPLEPWRYRFLRVWP